MTPRIFTGTPIEGHIIAVFMRAQATVAALLQDNPVFRGLLFVALTWAILHQFLKIATSHRQAGQAILTIVYRIAMVFLAIGLLRWDTAGVTFMAADRPWSSYPGVATDPRYEETLVGQPRTLWAYSLLYRALDGIAQATTTAAAAAFDDPMLTREPMFFAQQMARMSSFTLGPDNERLLVALLRDCGNTDAGRVVASPYTSLRELLELERDGCEAQWEEFQAAAITEGRLLTAQYPTRVLQQLVSQMNQIGGGGDGEERLANIALSFAVHRAAMDQLSAAAELQKTERALAKPEAAAESDESDAQADVGQDALERIALMNYLSGAPDPADPTYRGWSQLTNQFNALAPYIPAARGYIQGILAILFVLAAYSVGFGTWRFMQMWVLAEASMCLYRPVALLGYKVSQFFLLERQLGDAIAATGNDGLVMGGARILSEQISALQTVYVAFEIGAFMIFALGALACFRPLAALSGHFGHSMAGHMAGAVDGAGRAFGFGATAAPAAAAPVLAPAASIPVFVHSAAAAEAPEPTRGLLPAPPGASPAAVGGTGIQPADEGRPELWGTG